MIAGLLSGVLVVVIGIRLRPRPQRVANIVPADVVPADPDVPAPLRWRHVARLRSRAPSRTDPGDVAEWCSRLAARCRSGSTLAGAVRECDPPASAREPVTTIVLALERGASLADAVTDAERRPGLDLALTVVRACAVTGGPAAEPLDRAAGALRGRAAELADQRTHSAQARMSALVMTVLPVAMLVLLIATSAPARQAVASPIGTTCVVGGATLNLLGWHWMKRIIDRVAR